MGDVNKTIFCFMHRLRKIRDSLQSNKQGSETDLSTQNTSSRSKYGYFQSNYILTPSLRLPSPGPAALVPLHRSYSSGSLPLTPLPWLPSLGSPPPAGSSGSASAVVIPLSPSHLASFSLIIESDWTGERILNMVTTTAAPLRWDRHFKVCQRLHRILLKQSLKHGEPNSLYSLSSQKFVDSANQQSFYTTYEQALTMP